MLCSTSFSFSPQCWPRTWTIPPKSHYKTTLEERQTGIGAAWPKLSFTDCRCALRVCCAKGHFHSTLLSSGIKINQNAMLGVMHISRKTTITFTSGEDVSRWPGLETAWRSWAVSLTSFSLSRAYHYGKVINFCIVLFSICIRLISQEHSLINSSTQLFSYFPWMPYLFYH